MALHRKPLKEAHPALIPTVAIASTALLVIGIGIAVDPLIPEIYKPPATVEQEKKTPTPKVKPTLPEVLMIEGDADTPAPKATVTPVATKLPPTKSVPVPVETVPVPPVQTEPKVTIQSFPPVPAPPKVQLPPLPMPNPPKVELPEPLQTTIENIAPTNPKPVVPNTPPLEPITKSIPDVGPGVADELLDTVHELPVPGK